MDSMKAIVFHTAKDIDSLTIEDVPRPEPGPEEVLVRIRAAALNHRDVWITQGLYPGIKLPGILGSDGAGEVVAVGEEVDDRWLERSVVINPSLDWGPDMRAQQAAFRILGMPDSGTQAQYVAVPEGNVMEMPAHMSFEHAAAIPLGGVTGYRALFTQGGLMSGETALVTGIGGGVASLMAQMVLACGARLIATSSSEAKLKQIDHPRYLGGALYTDENWGKKARELAGEDGIDLIVDSAGGDTLNDYVDVVNPGGRIVFFGATRGNPSGLNLRKIFWKQITIQGTTMGHEQDFEHMIRLFEKQQVLPIIDGPYPMKDFRKAYQRMIDGAQTGKIVLTID